MDPVFDTSPGQPNRHAPVSAPPPGATSGPVNRPLWAAVGVLTVAVAALGAPCCGKTYIATMLRSLSRWLRRRAIHRPRR
ncbi:hypothetical protein GT347_12760 [Xylophilus rhododendri]|uniref:Uncharacterized protein n=1 Tax=Xylophilus rhododendri TaxID=2697032 RepID=A0A857J4A7_9BURK|nr:hypothetical protein [Xylophilus rhododendri]QHI98784.1 hypothetical protein GT347_12760 [Xylophilus rhododendri]